MVIAPTKPAHWLRLGGRDQNRVLTEDLQRQRDVRLASRLRGALGLLSGGQTDDVDTPVLLVPVMQAWLPSILAALKQTPLSENLVGEEE